MKPILKSIISSNVDLTSYVPDDAAFRVLVELEIGPEDSVGMDIFQLEVCSSKWLWTNRSRSIDLDSISWGSRPTLIVADYSFEAIVLFIGNYLSEIEGDSWVEVAEEINNRLAWEFDGYRESI